MKIVSEIFEEERADGSKTYYARIKYERSWLWKYEVVEYLHQGYSTWWAKDKGEALFRASSYEQCQCILNIAIQEKLKNCVLSEKIVQK